MALIKFPKWVVNGKANQSIFFFLGEMEEGLKTPSVTRESLGKRGY